MNEFLTTLPLQAFALVVAVNVLFVLIAAKCGLHFHEFDVWQTFTCVQVHTLLVVLFVYFVGSNTYVIAYDTATNATLTSPFH